MLLATIGTVLALAAGAGLVLFPLQTALLVLLAASIIAALRLGLRNAALAFVIIAFSAASFENATLAQIGFIARYPAAALVLMVTWHQARSSKSTHNSQLTTAARLLLIGSWLLVSISLISTVWSVRPSETILQAVAYALLVANMHVHATRWWNTRAAIRQDMFVAFWAMTATLAASLAAGTLMGGRLSGVYANPNTLALVALIALMLGIGLIADKPNLSTFLGLAVTVSTLALTQTRTAMLAVGFALLWVVVRRRRIPVFAALASIAGVIAVGLSYARTGSIPLPGAAERLSSAEGRGLDSRIEAWEYGVTLWQERPLAGYGFRTGEAVFQSKQFLTLFRLDSAHSSFVQILVELGTIGILVVAFIMAVALLASWRMPPAGLGLGLSGLPAAGFVSALTESALFGVGQVFSWTFWLFTMAALCWTRLEPESEAARKGKLQMRAAGSRVDRPRVTSYSLRNSNHRITRESLGATSLENV